MNNRDISTSCNECRYHYALWDNNGHDCYCVFENSQVDKIHILNCLDCTKPNEHLSGCKHFVSFVNFMQDERGKDNEINV